MPNLIKYNVSAETLALKKGNFWIGTGDVGKGPTSTTGFYNGITPPLGGYTIYLNKASNGPSIYTATNDSQLIDFTNRIAGTSYTTVNECFNYYASQSDKMVLNEDYLPIITTNLTLNYDAGFTPSYPRNGTTWYDISASNTNGTLTNGPTYNSNGYISFDATDDCVNITPSPNFGITNQFTIEVLCYPTTQVNGMFNFVGPNGSDRGIMAHWPWSSDYGYLDITNTSGSFYRWYKVSAGIQNVLALYQFRLDTSGNVSVRQNNNVMVPSGTDVFTGNVSLGSSSTIGAFYTNGSLAWGGNIYEFRIYNRALSEEEMSRNYYRANIVTENITNRWDFSNIVSYPKTGTSVKNLTGTANATLYNGPTFSPQYGGYFDFDGSDDYILLNDGYYSVTMGNGNLPWTINAWVRTTSSVNGLGNGSVISNSSGGPVYSMMGVNSGKIVYWTYHDGWYQSLGTKTVNDGNWHMLTWVNYSNYTMDMYVDGVLDVNVSNSTSGNNNPLDIIGGSWAARFNGDIGEIQINTKSFSLNEVRQQYYATSLRYDILLPPVTNGLILYWDPSNPNSYPGSGTVIYDLSGNGNHGTLYNGVGFTMDYGGVLTFDGVNDYVQGGPNMYNSNYTLMGASRYVSIGGRVIAATNNYLLGHWAAYTNDHYAEGWVYYNPVISDTNWSIYAGSGDIGNDSYQFYMNNTLLASNNGGSQGPNQIVLGCYGPGYEFSNSQVGPILLYNRVLSQSELTQNYNYLKGRFNLS